MATVSKISNDSQTDLHKVKENLSTVEVNFKDCAKRLPNTIQIRLKKHFILENSFWGVKAQKYSFCAEISLSFKMKCSFVTSAGQRRVPDRDSDQFYI